MVLFGLSVLLSLYSSANVYSATVMISQSPVHITIGLNVCLCLFFAIANALKTLLFGSLQTFELELLYEQFWITLTEIMLAITVFREAISISFFMLLSTLMFARVFHSICSFRTERLQIQLTDQRFHIFSRLTCAYFVLSILDASLIYLCFTSEHLGDKSTRMLFVCEFSVLLLNLTIEASKLCIYLYEARHLDQVWDEKSTYLFRLEVCRDGLRLLAYSLLFMYQFPYVSVPIYSIRQMYTCFYSLFRRIREHARFRQATRDMNAMYPTATEEQLTNSDRTCTICREEMFHPDHPPENTDEMEPLPRGLDMTPKRLPCGHILHFHCLRNWLERQQTCPICRRSVIGNQSSPTGIPASPNVRATQIATQVPNPQNTPTTTAVPGITNSSNQGDPQASTFNGVPNANSSGFAAHTQDLSSVIPRRIALRDGWTMLPIPGTRRIPTYSQSTSTTNPSATPTTGDPSNSTYGGPQTFPNSGNNPNFNRGIAGIVPPGWRLVSSNTQSLSTNSAMTSLYQNASSADNNLGSSLPNVVPLSRGLTQSNETSNTFPAASSNISSQLRELHTKIDELRETVSNFRADYNSIRTSLNQLEAASGINERIQTTSADSLLNSNGMSGTEGFENTQTSITTNDNQSSILTSSDQTSPFATDEDRQNSRNVQLETVDENF